MRVHRVAQRLAHLAALAVGGKAVSQQAPVRCAAIQGAAQQQRAVEPAAVLVVAFQIQVRLRTFGMEGRHAVSVFVAAAQHMLKGGARVEPDFQNVGALGIERRVLCAQNLFHRHAAPGFDAAFFNNVSGLVQDGHGVGVQFARVLVQEERHRHAPRALARDAPVGPVGDHVAQAGLAVLGVELRLLDRVERQLAQGLGRFILGEHALALVHPHKPLSGSTVDDGGFMTPAVRVAVGDFHRGHQAVALAQHLDHAGTGFPDVLAAEERQLFGVHAIALHRVQDVVIGQAVGDAGVEVVHAVGGGRVHDAGAVGGGHVLGQIQGRWAAVAVWATFVSAHGVVQRVAENQAAQLLAHCGGDHGALQLVALQAFFDQTGSQQQHATGRVHQGIFQLGVGVERLVGGNRPSGGGPDDGKCFLAALARQFGQAKGGSQCGGVVGFKGHVQRVALFVGVFDLEFGQRRAAVKAPVNGFEAAVNKATLNHALKGADFTGFVGEVHGAVRALPVAQHAQALEVFALLADLLGGKGAALGLHVVSGQLAAMQFFDRVFDRQAVAVPAGNVLRVKARQLLGLDDHVFENFVQCVADVQFAVGVRRAVVQHEQRGALAGGAQFFVEAAVVPLAHPARLALGQVAAHRKRGVHHVDAGVGVLGFVGHGASSREGFDKLSPSG